MIKIQKLPCPNSLQEKSTEWTEEILQITDKSERRARIRKLLASLPEIKKTVQKETFEKCAYCESMVRHVYPGDLEHIEPSSKNPNAAFQWENLTYACSWCNSFKRDYFEKDDPLIDPTLEDPDKHLVFVGTFLIGRDKKGATTLDKVGLNRKELLQMRAEAFSGLTPLIQSWVNETDDERKALKLREIRLAIRGDKEFSKLLRDSLKTIPNLEFGET